MTLTKRQTQVLSLIERRQRREGVAPSLREICAELGLASPGSLLKHLQALEAAGLVRHQPGQMRAWRLAGPGPGATIPVLGRIAAGEPILAEENREDDLPVDPALFGCRESFGLRVQGDSMIEAFIRDGDIAIIKPQPTAANGQIVAVLVEGVAAEATLKILKLSPGRIELHPANPRYSPLVVIGEDLKRVRILGQMVGLIRIRP